MPPWHLGYQEIQSTKPETLGQGLSDSPVGLASWILEKWYGWSDHDGDLEKVFTRDELLHEHRDLLGDEHRLLVCAHLLRAPYMLERLLAPTSLRSTRLRHREWRFRPECEGFPGANTRPPWRSVNDDGRPRALQTPRH